MSKHIYTLVFNRPRVVVRVTGMLQSHDFGPQDAVRLFLRRPRRTYFQANEGSRGGGVTEWELEV